MLVLYRKEGEGILIGEHTRIRVVEASSGGVRLAIEAPRDISIIREELSAAVRANEDSLLPAFDSVQLFTKAWERRTEGETPTSQSKS